MAFVSFHFHGPAAVSVINGPPLRGGGEAPLDNVSGDPDAVRFDLGTGLFHHFLDLGVPAFESHLFDHVKCRLFDFPDLIIGQNPHAHGAALGTG
jgi:hypothetical protein